MINVQLHREIYASSAVDEAVEVFSRYGNIAKQDVGSHWSFAIEVPVSADRERQLAGEFCNYALGLTVRTGGAGT